MKMTLHIGVPRSECTGITAEVQIMARFFGAPVAIIVTLDAEMGAPQVRKMPSWPRSWANITLL